MHTFESGDARLHYNSDLSGDVEIVDKDGNRVSVPGYFILHFVANYVKEKQIEELENKHWVTFLNLGRS